MSHVVADSARVSESESFKAVDPELRARLSHRMEALADAFQPTEAVKSAEEERRRRQREEEERAARKSLWSAVPWRGLGMVGALVAFYVLVLGFFGEDSPAVPFINALFLCAFIGVAVAFG